jgi:hypothetical protein
MSAELVDPFAPRAEPLQEDEADLILQAVNNHPWEDPTRYQHAFRILYVAAASIASGYVPGREQQRATQALREVMQRVLIGEMQAEVDHHG